MAAPQGVSIAFDDPTLEPDPTWTRIDTGRWKVTSWELDRGRSDELSQTGTGTARITLHDNTGDFDPTNSGGTFFGRLLPLKQAAIALWNPVDAEWNTQFRGYIEEVRVDVDVTERFTEVQIDLVDGFEVLSSALLRVGSAGGFNAVPGAVPHGAEGNVYYQADNVNDRITTVLADADWPSELAEIFSGNIHMPETVYAPDTQALAALQDAADAEFPGVSNLYMNRQGAVTFHGRFARFNPDNALYHISQWKVGDVGAFAGDSNTAVASALGFRIGKESVINSALATPQNALGTAIAGLLREDASSIGTYGLRPWSAENLLIDSYVAPLSSAATTVCGTIAQYYVDNFAQPQIRISELKMTTPPPWHTTATRVWRTMSETDISDIFHVATTHFGTSAAGFGTVDFFVEGIHMQASALGTSYLSVEATYDLSPRANYGTATFGTA